MSFPGFRPPVEVEAQVVSERSREIKATAARYAQLHPEGDAGERSDGPIRRGLARARRALRRRS